MGLFQFSKTPTFDVNVDVQSEGIYFTIVKDQQPVVLPVKLTIKELKQMNNIEMIQLIEDLWYDEKIMEDKKGYMLHHEEVYHLEPEERSLLGIPENPESLSIKVENESFVGSRQFKMKPVFHSDDIRNLQDTGERKGPFIELSGTKRILLPEEQYSFLELVENHDAYEKEEDLFYHIAQVKKRAEELSIPVSEHLARENYEFIDDIEINVEQNESGIHLIPEYRHEELGEDVLHDENLIDTGYTKHQGRRVFADSKAQTSARTINSMEPITGADIPRFAQNPDAYIDESVEYSTDLFSERVKGLGIRVYKASPFVSANDTQNGWFDFDTGFHVKDEEGNTISSLEDQFFSEGEGGSFKQLDDNTFVSVPEEAEKFQQYTKKLKEENEKEDAAKTNSRKYILEIFENIQHVEYDKELEDWKASYQNHGILEKQPPASFHAKLHPFQQDGFIWMKSLWFTGNGGLLADDMGLGKTIQVIAYMAFLKKEEKLTPSLLVLPKTLIDNWINEIEKFAPALSESCYVHLNQNRLKDPEAISTYDIVLTTYHTLARDQLILGQVDWQIVIGDEAQAIKNPTTGASVVLKALKNRGRLALTGTPVENNLSELWSIIDFVQPGLLGSLKQFKETYEKPLQKEGTDYDDIQKEIEEKIQFVYKRRTKAGELVDQLPNKFEHREGLKVPLGKEQHEKYASVVSQIKNKELPAIEGIQKLKRVLSHPALIDDSLTDLRHSKVPKLERTISLLQKIKLTNEKVLIFTEYRKMQSILKKHIASSFGLNPMIINGSTASRQHLVDAFNKDEGFDVLILTPKAAGTGLTITSANHVIHYTRWWNPAVENQATDRVYRIGQEKDVHVYYPIVVGDAQGNTVEETVDQLLKEKKALAENVIVPSKDLEVDEIMAGM